MSAAHTWFGRSITRSRSRYGKIMCPGAGLVVRGFGTRAAIPISRISRCTPTPASWLNAAEGFLHPHPPAPQARRLQVGQPDAGGHHPLHPRANKTPKPFAWTKTAKAILAKLNRLLAPSK
jgi:hypothetical protein